MIDTELSAENPLPHNTRSTDDSGRRLTDDLINSADGMRIALMMLLGCVDATLTRPWSQQLGLLGGGDDMMDDDETPSGKRDTGQAPTVTEEPRSQRRCKQSQMAETEPDTMLIDQNEASNQLSNDRIDVSPERRVITQTGKRNATQTPTLTEDSQSVHSRKRLAGDPGISLTSVVQECAGKSSSYETVATSDIGLSDTEGLVSSNMTKVGMAGDTDDHDKLFLTMANVGNTCFLSSSIHLAGLLLGYSKIRLLDPTHDPHSHVDAGHMTRIRDRYARLDSTYTTIQPHDAARALEMILQSNSGRSERADWLICQHVDF